MSNTCTQLSALDPVTTEEMQTLCDAPETASEQAPVPPKKKKHIASRLWAILLAALPIVLLCVFPTLILTQGAGHAITADKSLLDAFIAIFKELIGQDGFAGFYEGIQGAPTDFSGNVLFGFLPILNDHCMFGHIYSVYLYFVLLMAVVTVIMAIVALFSGKAAPAIARSIAGINLVVYFGYALIVDTVSLYYNVKIDYTSIPAYMFAAIIGVSALFFIVYSFIKAKGKGVVNFVLLILSAGFLVCLAYPYFFEGVQEIIAATRNSTQASIIPFIKESDLLKYLTFTLVGLSLFSLFVACVRMPARKGYVFHAIINILNMLAAAVLVVVAFTQTDLQAKAFMEVHLFFIIALAICILQIVICCVAANKKKAKAAPAVEEQPAVEQPVEETPVEEEPVEEQPVEEVEAVVFETEEEPEEEPAQMEIDLPEEEPVEEEPVEEQPEEEPVQEPAPAPAPAPVPAPAPAGYDFYNSRSFDPFIASLNDEERKQFTDLFILKYNGGLRNIPDYIVGGDNREFFRKIFIYLGQHRAMIPDGLLAKMYMFASRN